jgi:hypothetical protein
MNWKEILFSKEFKHISLFGIILILIGVGLHFSGKTVLNVDQIYCRGFYPWSALYQEKNCDPGRDGDSLFDTASNATELDYLTQNPYQHSYTERVMNGYPIASAYNVNPHNLTRAFDKFLPITSSANFVALAYLFLSFVIGYVIARTLKFTPGYSAVFGFFSITSTYVGLVEPFSLSLIGFGLVVLGILQYYYCDRKYLFVILTFVGAICIMLSAVFQFYIYAAICVLLLILMSFLMEDRKRFLIMAVAVGVVFIAAALVLNTFLVDHASFLSVSNKMNSSVSFSELLKHKNYALDPLGWIGIEPIELHRKMVATVLGDNIGYSTYGSLAMGSQSPGPVFLGLFFIGIISLWQSKKREYRGYVIFTLFWLLYSAGYLQLLFSIIIGSPFREETSIRAFDLFFLFGTFAVVYAIQNLIQRGIILGKSTKRIIKIFFLYLIVMLPIFIVARFYGHGQVLLETIFIVISSILFFVWLYLRDLATMKNRGKALASMLLVSLLLLSFSRLFLGATPVIFLLNPSKLYYPETEFGDIIKKYPDLKRAALIQTPQSGRVQHQNGPIFLGLSTITGYRNPMYQNYADLYYYNSFVFKDSKNAVSDFNDFEKNSDYLRNNLSAFEAPQAKITLSEATKRFFAMTDVDTIIGSVDLEITNPEWHKITIADNLTLWGLNKTNPEFFFVQKETVIPAGIKQFEYMFGDSKWNPIKSAVLDSSILEESNADNGASKENPNIELIKRADGYRLIKIQNIFSPGILTIPVTFDKHWEATLQDLNGSHLLKTFTSNGAFLGILVPKSLSGIIELRYNDKPSIKNYLLSATGIFILLLVFFIFRKKKQPALDSQQLNLI